MITILQCAQLCADTYAETPSAPWASLWTMDDVIVGHRQIDGFDCIALRGSKTAEDWIRDCEGWPVWHDAIGFCHGGFLAGMDDALGEVLPAAQLPIVVTGHSLGGARARILAALLAIHGKTPAMLYTFGSPKPGFANVSRVIQKSGMAHGSARNRNDPVPLVAAVLPFWEHPDQWTAFDEEPPADDLTPFRDHHVNLYVQGASKL